MDEHGLLIVSYLRGHGVAVLLADLHHLLFGHTLKICRRDVTEWEGRNFFISVSTVVHLKHKRRTS